MMQGLSSGQDPPQDSADRKVVKKKPDRVAKLCSPLTIEPAWAVSDQASQEATFKAAWGFGTVAGLRLGSWHG